MGNVKGNFQKMVLAYKSQRFINHYLSLQAVSDGLFVKRAVKILSVLQIILKT